MQIKNLYANVLEDDGSLRIYDKKNTITIKGNKYSISDGPYHKIYNTKRYKYADYLGTEVKDKYVYHLRPSDNNNEEIYVSLSYWQNLKFLLMNLEVKKKIKRCKKPLSYIVCSVISSVVTLILEHLLF